MKRTEFLKYLAGFAGLGWMVPVSPAKPEAFRYIIYEGWTAGYSYYDGPSIEQQLRDGQELQLCREPGNRYDKRAIEICAGKYKLGYIPRVDNHVLARLMDQKVPLKAEIAAVRQHGQMYEWERVMVRVWMGNFEINADLPDYIGLGKQV
jgi:hypothetical protein